MGHNSNSPSLPRGRTRPAPRPHVDSLAHSGSPRSPIPDVRLLHPQSRRRKAPLAFDRIQLLASAPFVKGLEVTRLHVTRASQVQEIIGITGSHLNNTTCSEQKTNTL